MPNPMPTEFWLTRGGEVRYVERYDRYTRKLVVVDENGNEFEHEPNGLFSASARTYDDLVRRLEYTSFPVKERVSK